MADMTLEEVEQRIRVLREEIEGLSTWGAGVTVRLEEIYSLQHRRHWLKRNESDNRTKASEEGAVTHADRGDPSPD